MRRIAIGIVVLSVVPLSAAQAKGYQMGYYTGRTSQGSEMSFVVAGGQVSHLFTTMTDTCSPGRWYVTLYPKASRIDSHGNWSHRVPGSFPTVFHGHLSGSRARGTIDDQSENNQHRRCHGRVSFHATPGGPLRVGSANVGGNGTDVIFKLSVPAAFNGTEDVPYTALGMLVYGSNTGCRGSYQAADAQARNAQSDGQVGLISDAYVTADYGFAVIKGHARGTFTFDVSTNALVPAPAGRSPFSTVCAMLYSGQPGTLHPSRNIAVDTTHGRLVRGPGIPTNQP
ncbi:MAG: hypothetical protein WBP81_36655 [Solirubrobacteraceae bacterium]